MASKAQQLPSFERLRLDLLLRPMPAPLFAMAALAVLVLGAAYCSGYEKLLSDTNNWPASLIWAAYGLLPWLLLFECVKRVEWDADKPLPSGRIALLMLATWGGSVALEWLHHAVLLGKEDVALALPVLRRVPGVGVLLLLITLSRRERNRADRSLGGSFPAEGEIELLRLHAPRIRWIQAADNYLELHGESGVLTRRITMRAAEQALQPLGFVRVHRSVLVNRSHVARIVTRSRGPTVHMVDGTALPTGRAFAPNLKGLH